MGDLINIIDEELTPIVNKYDLKQLFEEYKAEIPPIKINWRGEYVFKNKEKVVTSFE